MLLIIYKKEKHKVSKKVKNKYSVIETFWKPNLVEKKSVIRQHTKASHNLSKTIRRVEKVSQTRSGKNTNSSLYSGTKKCFGFFGLKKFKNNKRSTCF